MLLSFVFLFQRMLSFFVPKKCNTGRSLNLIKVFIKLLYKIFFQVPGWELPGLCPYYSKEFDGTGL